MIATVPQSRALPLPLTPRADEAIAELRRLGVEHVTAIEVVGSFERGLSGFEMWNFLFGATGLHSADCTQFITDHYPAGLRARGRRQ